MRRAIAIIGYNRPAHFRMVVNSLDQQRQPPTADVHVFLDGPHRPCQEKHVRILKETKHLRLATVHRRSERWGCGRNIIDARIELFDRRGYDRVFIFEDDLVVSPDYVRLLDRLATWAQSRFNNIGTITAWNICDQSAAWKIARSSQVIAKSVNLWGYVMDAPQWAQIQPILDHYQRTFLADRAYEERHHEAIRQYLRETAACQPPRRDGNWPCDWEPFTPSLLERPPTGQDAITHAALAAKGLVALATVANRAKYIGFRGVHTNLKLYRQLGFDRVHLEHMPDDQRIEEFEPVETE